MKKFSFALLAIVLPHFAHATTYIVSGATIGAYVQSTSSGSTAHLIRSNIGIYGGGAHPWCGNRAYIDTSDKELLTAAIAASMSSTPVSFIYEDNAPPRNISGHVNGFVCKVISIF